MHFVSPAKLGWPSRCCLPSSDSRPEASHGWRVHAYRRGDGTGWGQPGLAGKTKCVVPSVGKSGRAARENVVLAQAALGHG